MFSKSINKELDLLSESNNYRAILGLIKDYTEIIFSVALSMYFDNLFVYLLSIILIGSRQRALATILHDSAHRVLCRNKVINDIIGKYLSGYLIFQSLSTYVKSHVINHHNYLGDKDKDPDYIMYINSGITSETNKNRFIQKHLILPLFLIKTPKYTYYIIKNRFFIISKTESIKILTLWLFIGVVGYYTSTLEVLILYWFIPLFTTFPLIGWYIELSEHYPIISNKNDIDKSWNRFGNRFENYFTGMHNENYHLTHHLRPDIPYWNIKKAHTIMMQDTTYSNKNNRMGGIFTSNSNARTILQRILDRLD
jgi:fatty acid desaturase